MPKLMTAEQRQFASDLRERHGGMMTLTDICEELGRVDLRTAKEFIGAIPRYEFGRWCKYRVEDVAKAIIERRCV